MAVVLKTDKITKSFGGLLALDEMTLDFREQEIVALIGPNGAGKTTFFNNITGMYTPTSGTVEIFPPNQKSVKIQGMKPNLITELGLARTFQNIRLFGNMTVIENVMVGRHCRTKSHIFGAVFQTSSFKREEKESVEKSFALLEMINMSHLAGNLAKNLSYADQRRLEIARALATDPFLLLLDEPAAGMNPQETEDLDQLIVHLRDELKITILLIEHDMKLVMKISDRIFVMNQGRLIAQGTPVEIQNNPEVIKAYLGE
ncbi:MAG: ABC transporter ATP-binding protein [SAR324 cluster bacterium]|uniref:ABC transporter ATP-binding protein n=1 Tax=SAR324 cluster bacterium TaxID=2024889 RepID=A0A2A4SVE0_9DELT|nr:MAG: ABC transporter ATP-binding protein [SAR324 cluster bacterium]